MIQFPKNALQRIILGQSFAEYDIIRDDPTLFVTTPASLAAENAASKKLVFVGRRGAGKTAITINLSRKQRRVVELVPQVFDLIKLPLGYDEFRDTRQRPFKSLVCAFERALLHELLRAWIRDKVFSFDRNTVEVFSRERNLIEGCDFDFGLISILEEIFAAYRHDNPKQWLRQIKRSQELDDAVNASRENSGFEYTFLIDRIDESWDGNDSSIIALMALMHASVRLVATNRCIRPCVFLRENIYERIRSLDNEFSRIETSVAMIEWSSAKLEEMVERRLARPFPTKPSLGGEAWGCFFEESAEYSAKREVFSICQPRPRDVLMFVSFALENAISNGHQKIDRNDIESAQDRYSTSRLKDLADEFDENYPNIQVVLGYFYGLSTSYTILAIEHFIQKLLVDPVVAKRCAEWFFNVTTPALFVDILYRIGFIGIQTGQKLIFRGTATEQGFSPKVEQISTIVVHPAYHRALRLRSVLLKELSDDMILKTHGILEELPEGITFDQYKDKLEQLLTELRDCPLGHEGAARFEEIVGQVIRLCFFRSLTNVEPKVRTIDGRTCKDWIAANHAADGFWEMVRVKYGAVQVVWECKNYQELAADDFHQVAYYMNDRIGRFAILAFRGDALGDAVYKHIARIAASDVRGMVVVLRQRDLEVFLRQALNGKVKEAHLQEIFDKAVRQIS